MLTPTTWLPPPNAASLTMAAKVTSNLLLLEGIVALAEAFAVGRLRRPVRGPAP